MTKTSQVRADTATTWTKPELVRLGMIVDVAGPKVIGSDGTGGFANS